MKNSNFFKEIITGASISFFLKSSSALFTLIFNILLARLTGAEGSGLFYIGLSVLMVVVSIVKFGQTNGMIRFISAYANNNEWEKAVGYYRQSVFVVFCLAIFFTVLIFTTSDFLAVNLFSKPEVSLVLKCTAIVLIPYSLMFLHSYALQGLKKIRDAMISQGFSVFLVASLLLWLSNGYGGSSGAMLFVGVGSCIGLAYALIIWRRNTGKVIKPVFMKWNYFISVSSTLMVAETMGLIINWAPSIILGISATSEEVGIFSTASRVAWLVSFVLIAVNSIVAPKFAELYARKDLNQIKKVAKKGSMIMAIAVVPFAGIMLFFPEKVMMLFGSEFESGAIYLQIIAIGQIVNSLTGSVGFLLTMTGHEKIQRNIVILSAIATIVLCFILIPFFGAIGAAIVLAAVLSVSNIVAIFYVKKYLGFYSIPFIKI
jgi:O-antigen/teichoic acid export membrane protein